MYGGSKEEKSEGLNVLDGIPGAVASIANAVVKFYRDTKRTTPVADGKHTTRAGDGKRIRQWPIREGFTELWKQYMVPEGIDAED